MEEFQNIKNEFEALKASLADRNIDEIGIIELRRIKGDLERLHSRNLEVQERVRFDRTIDTVEVFEVLNQGNVLYDEIAELLRPVSENVRAKAVLGMSKVRARRDLVNARNRNQELINMFNSDLTRMQESLTSVTDETIKGLYNQNIVGIQENINRLNEVDAYYAGLISNLDSEIETLRLGGKVPEFENIEEETRGITSDEEEELRRKAHEDTSEEPEKVDDGAMVMPPRPSFEEDKPEEAHDEEPSKEEPKEEPEKIDDGAMVMPPRPSFEEDKPEEEAHDEESHEEEPKEEPEKVDDGAMVMPPRPSFEEDKPEEETHDEESSKEEPKEEETAVDASVKQPKSTLWQKLQPVIEAVKGFLLVAITMHTGLLLHNSNVELNNAQSKETAETENEEESQEEAPAEEETPEEEESPSETPIDIVIPTPGPTPAPADETPEDEHHEEERITIELAPGEVAYDATTGVEVNAAGNAVVHHEDGTTGVLSDRELSHTDTGASIVHSRDLENDGEIVFDAPPRTGQEVSEEEARKNMSDQEEANFDEALQDAFQSFFSNGPTL